MVHERLECERNVGGEQRVAFPSDEYSVTMLPASAARPEQQSALCNMPYGQPKACEALITLGHYGFWYSIAIHLVSVGRVGMDI